MRVAKEKIVELTRHKGLSISKLLENAGVSRNAYYSLARRSSILPRSIEAIAGELGVSPCELLDVGTPQARLSRQLARDVEKVLKARPDSDPDNVRHTLLLLRERPADRLRRALTRGKGAAACRQRNQVP